MCDLAYYGEPISPNKIETRDGYLICLDVPIARTGSQRYLKSELQITDEISDFVKDGENEIYRSEQEVFDEKTIASFEGAPLTYYHPNEQVNSSNWKTYAEGVVTNVRRGAGEFSNNLIADIRINNASLVTIVENKIMEQISCGYTCDWEVIDGKIHQVNIRGNHVAIVPRGRAGDSVAIRDGWHNHHYSDKGYYDKWNKVFSNIGREGSNLVNEDVKSTTLLGKLIEFIKPQTVEDIKQLNRIVGVIDEDYDSTKKPIEEDACKKVEDEGDVKNMEDSKINELVDKIDLLIDAMVASKQQDKDVEEAVEDEKVIEKEIKEKVVVTGEEEQINRASVLSDSAIQEAKMSLVADLQPVVASLVNSEDRKVMSDALYNVITGVSNTENPVNNAENFLNISTANAEKTMKDSMAGNPYSPESIAERAKMEQEAYMIPRPSMYDTKGGVQ